MAKPNGKYHERPTPSGPPDMMLDIDRHKQKPSVDLAMVRRAGPADEVEIYRLLLLAHAETSLFPHSNERVQYYVQRFLNPNRIHPNDTGPRGIFGVIGDVGNLVALAMVGLGQYWYTDHKHLEEYLMFVDPAYRTDPKRYAVVLIEWLKRQADDTSFPLLHGVISNHRTEAKCRLYRRILPKVGEYFLYNPVFREVPVFHADTVTGPGSMVQSSSLALR